MKEFEYDMPIPKPLCITLMGIKVMRIKDTLPTIYFAHPFDKWKTKREKMIEKILEERGFRVVNPFTEEDELNKKYGVDNYYNKPSKPFASEIVDKDFLAVMKTDAYFGWFPKGVTVIGTPIELVWAVLLRKKVIVLTYKPHPFLIEFSNVFYTSYKDFKNDKPFSNKMDNYNLLEKVNEYNENLSRKFRKDM